MALTRCYDLVDTNLQLLDLLFCVEVPGLRCVNPNHLLGYIHIIIYIYIGMYNFEIIFGERMSSPWLQLHYEVSSMRTMRHHILLVFLGTL